jgi:hypothetical protein
MELNCTDHGAEFRDPARKMTKIGAKAMQFHSESSNIVPLRLHWIEKDFGSSLAG